MDKLQIKTYDSILKITPEAWIPLQAADFPFTDYAFLAAMESSGCLGLRTGWTPIYITAWLDGILNGVVILYAKTNSYGEFIFDFAWAEAAHSSGFNYYPKIISAVPFTPATGSKILLLPGTAPDVRGFITSQLLGTARGAEQSSGSSSLHFLFIPEQELTTFKDNGFFIRHSFQYHWYNDTYKSFDEFLLQLTGKRRREVIRERKQVKSQDVVIEWVLGDKLAENHAEIMYAFYESTLDKKQGFDYLTKDFFKTLFLEMRDKIHLVLAKNSAGQPVAGVLNLFGSERLFGRYWGCLAEYRALHFEMCYYQGIEFCIKQNLKQFEAGAQGDHKFQRGFLPSLTYSAHHIQNQGLDNAVREFVEHEKNQIKKLFIEYAEHSPFS